MSNSVSHISHFLFTILFFEMKQYIRFRIAILTAVSVFCVLAARCTSNSISAAPSNEELLAGISSKTWSLTKIVAMGTDGTSQVAFTQTFKRDGSLITVVTKPAAQTDTGKWKLSGTTLTLTASTGSDLVYKIESLAATELKVTLANDPSTQLEFKAQ